MKTILSQLKNKYSMWYYTICERAINRQLSESIYTEKHHVLPKCLDGDDSEENLVTLTTREHFICHWLLTKMIDSHKITYAFQMMFVDKTSKRYAPKSSRIYELLRIKFSKNNQGSKGCVWYTNGITNIFSKIDPGGEYYTGKTFSKETRMKISAKAKLRKMTTETKEKMSLSRKGKPGVKHTESTRKQMSESATGRKHSIETKEKMRISKLGVKRGPYKTTSKDSV